MNNRLSRSFLALLSTVALLLAMASTAAAAPQGSAHDRLLSVFEQNLRTKADAGDLTATANLDRLSQLSDAQREDLAEYLSGPNLLDAVKNVAAPVLAPAATDAVSTTVYSDGQAQVISTTGTSVSPAASGGAVALAAALYNVHAYADENFTFLGISIVKTRIWADYVTNAVSVTSITNYGGYLVHDYDPSATVTVSKQSKSLSGGIATFKTLVVVKRGPIPYLGITWSTRSGIQYMKVNGSTGVIAHGWTT